MTVFDKFPSLYYRLVYVLQKDGKNNTKTAKISNLPNNIAKDNIHFEISETWLKLPFGPIISPKPGPTFDIAEAAAENAVRKSKLNRLNDTADKINMNIYIKKKPKIEL